MCMSIYGLDCIFMVVSWEWIEYWKYWAIGLIDLWFEVTFGRVMWGGSSGKSMNIYIRWLLLWLYIYMLMVDLNVWYIVMTMLTHGANYDHLDILKWIQSLKRLIVKIRGISVIVTMNELYSEYNTHEWRNAGLGIKYEEYGHGITVLSCLYSLY